MNKTKYAYALGRIRVLETKLLTPDIILRMVETEDFEGAYHVLEETTYAEHLAQVIAIAEFRKVLGLELARTKKLLENIAPDFNLLTFLWLKYDFHNIKVLLKAKYTRIEAEQEFIHLGNYEVNGLKNYILNGIKDGLPQEVLETIDKTSQAFEKDKDPQIIDILLDKYYYSWLKNRVDLISLPYFSMLLDLWIDLTNIQTLIRIKGLERNEDFFKEVIIPGGKIEKDTWLKAFRSPTDEIPKLLRFTPYSKIVDEGITFYLKNKSLCLLEKLAGDFFMEHIKKARYIALGLEPLIGYALAKESEVKNLRTILVLKRNEVPVKIIKERLCEVYA